MGRDCCGVHPFAFTYPSPPFLPDLASLNLNSGSSGASDQDTLAPLPHPSVPWPLGQGYPYQYPGPPPCFPPAYQDPGFSYGSGSAGSQQSEGESHANPSSHAHAHAHSHSLALPGPDASLCAPAVCLSPGGSHLKSQCVDREGQMWILSVVLWVEAFKRIGRRPGGNRPGVLGGRGKRPGDNVARMKMKVTTDIK